ncbi:hypothetical protein B9Q01_02400 [Candidatus Marsarchaeota G1 archaeon OSP_D]|jgi:hypothetical protein|uniref:Uncharacterized protein n=3 Tax=Candidatus Marsarchaeota group 1 TaxID=2203770 RepID=A0A2R6AGQ8_9ARCH|nr:MAG: hypothetical protein B9Q01_02400 [Candidatus Marsarchaeota G1 archaeon OSP_D]PSN85518.1 MAG: hypothetical protein B9Q02_06145 [Candidatus Marsarchaeota G1 archaeon BE_D]PSN87109.1 MAG: hypothetical protein B9Q00_09735 [Candidatus Marsarchaeota G1 archaeon OSP_C]
MAKVLFLIISGKEAPQKAELGIIVAARSVLAKRYEDLKVIFFGPSQEYITKLSGQAKEHFEILLKNRAIDSACVNIAQNMGIKPELEALGVELLPAGERIAHYVNQGYQVITF